MTGWNAVDFTSSPIFDQLMTKPYVYSPRQMLAYRLPGVPLDEVQVLAESEVREPAWNLFWLSNPDIDKVPDAGNRWHRVYTPQRDLLAHVIEDIYGDEALRRRLVLHPHAFADWFENQDYGAYLLFNCNGGSAWVQNVMDRARIAGDRLLVEGPVVQVADNVIRVNFGQRAA